MSNQENFISIIKGEFEDDRLTWQKAVPTFHPESADEVVRFFKLANEQKQPLFITGFGNNIDPVGEPFVNMISVRNDRLNQLIEIAPADFYVRVGSGYPLKELNKELAKEKLWFPHAALPYVGSAGGAVAVGLEAELHGAPVPIKKYLIQARIVTPEGELIEPGSVCFKSVSGYDIVKLFARSWGLLGLIVDLTFRVMPESGAADFAAMHMKEIDRKKFLAGLDPESTETDVIYSRKVKAKFDPANILPIV